MSTCIGHPQISRSYLVCTLPRSGSWLLCRMLAATGVAGKPIECFHQDFLDQAPRQSARHYVENAVRSGTTGNGVFGGKVHWSQFAVLSRLHDPAGHERMLTLLSDLLPNLRFVWLTRRDKVRQAISYYRAIGTGVWWQVRGDRPCTRTREPTFDYDTINRFENSLTNQDSRWQALFETFDIDPFLVVYEDLAEYPEQALIEFLDALGLPVEGTSPSDPVLVQQADEVSEMWLERYLAMKVRRITVPVSRPPPRLNRVEDQVTFNRREIRVAALQRSGHHGVINWIAGQSDSPLLFLNDARPGTNPFFTATIVSRSGSSAELAPIPRAAVAPFAPRACLVHSYEDRPLKDVFCDEFETHHDDWVGASAERSDVIVVRDPFNTFASRMRASWMRHQLTEAEGRATVIALWKEYAREALGETRIMPRRRVVILFNLWIGDQDYRRERSSALGLSFSDAGFRKLSPEYGASSFDGMRFDGRTEEMPLLERWKEYVDDALFHQIFADPEIWELSDALFEPIEGTECFRRSSRKKRALTTADRDRLASRLASASLFGAPGLGLARSEPTPK
jgi:LPS sulfotransferase NodH